MGRSQNNRPFGPPSPAIRARGGGRERGETLVETLVALAIVALAMLMVPMSVAVAARVTSGSERVAEGGQVELDADGGTVIEGVGVRLRGEGIGAVELGQPEVRRGSEGGLYYYA